MNSYFKIIVLIIVVFATSIFETNAQPNLTADELFQLARKAAFDKKNYLKAKQILKQALVKSPDYADIRIFLGRIYTWSDEPDSARVEFSKVLVTAPQNEDAYMAFGYLEYWQDNNARALDLANKGLSFTPKSAGLMLLKAKILSSNSDYKGANAIVNQVLVIDPKNSDARSLSNNISDNSSSNRVGLSYDYFSFGNYNGRDSWNLASVDISQQTQYGSVTGRVNYANRFKSNGVQFEIDAYPRISKTFYSYLNVGYSGNVGVFPKTKAGFSLYAKLPRNFEGEGGVRYLNFSSATWIYTASLGKYYKNYWFNFRTYLTPASTSNISQSYSLTTRYYYGGADDYWMLTVGTGISPDENNSVLLGQSVYKLKSNNIGAAYNHAFKTLNVIQLNASFSRQEYQVKTIGNQFNIGISLQRRF